MLRSSAWQLSDLNDVIPCSITVQNMPSYVLRIFKIRNAHISNLDLIFLNRTHAIRNKCRCFLKHFLYLRLYMNGTNRNIQLRDLMRNV